MDSAQPHCACLLLAAGASTRMGRPKQLLDVGGMPLVRRIALQLLAVPNLPLWVVLGAQAPAVEAALSGLPLHATVNERWEAGMGASIAAGMTQMLATHPQLQAVVIAVADQPFLSADVVTQLLAVWRQTGASAVVARYNPRQWGTPCLLSRVYFTELLALDGAAGARPLLLRREGDAPAAVNFPDGLLDLDTPADWEAYLQRINGR